MSAASDYPTLSFRSPEEWEEWLDENHDRAAGVWLRMFKKGSGQTSITYAGALDVALCYGWIDSQARGLDDVSYVQKFTPRRARSPWSKRNTQHIERLTKAGRMRPAGLAQVEAAMRDGRWTSAYDSPSDATMPEDFLAALEANAKAKAFFATLNKRNTYPIAYRLQSAKRPETRERRIRAIIDMLAKGEKFYP
ncbi:MAG: YdeI/OmpD-associated family protein [Dehalococcoidia bacterium]